MGHHVHHALLVTSWKVKAVKVAHERAKAILTSHQVEPDNGYAKLVTPITKGVINNFASFAIVPDGSKEGWSTSNAVDAARSEIVAMLREMVATDQWLDFIEVSFGGDEGDPNTRILNHDSDDKAFPDDQGRAGEGASARGVICARCALSTDHTWDGLCNDCYETSILVAVGVFFAAMAALILVLWVVTP